MILLWMPLSNLVPISNLRGTAIDFPSNHTYIHFWLRTNDQVLTNYFILQHTCFLDVISPLQHPLGTFFAFTPTLEVKNLANKAGYYSRKLQLGVFFPDVGCRNSILFSDLVFFYPHHSKRIWPHMAWMEKLGWRWPSFNSPPKSFCLKIYGLHQNIPQIL